MNVENRKTIAPFVESMIEIAARPNSQVSTIDLCVLADKVSVALDGTDIADVSRRFAKSLELKSTALKEFRDQLQACDPVWLYEPQEEHWHVYKVHGDGFHDTVGIVETEGLAIRLISRFDNANGPAPECPFEDVPAGYRIEAGSNDDWDLYRTVEGDDEEWFASLSTEYLSIAMCHILEGNL